MQNENKLKGNKAALKTIIIYMIFGGIWIFFSDLLLSKLISNPAVITSIQTVKGWFFILVTSFILYMIIRRYINIIQSSALESQLTYKELCDLLPQAVFETDLNGKLIFGNRSGWQMFGYKPESSTENVLIFNHIIEEDRDRAKENFAKLINSGRSNDNQYTAIRLDKSIFTCVVYSNRVIDEDKCVGIRGILIDITGQKKIEEELRKSEERYRTFIEMANDAIFIADVETGIIIDANLKAEKLIGRTKSEIIGMHQSELHPAEETEKYKNHFKRDSHDSLYYLEDIYVKDKNGRLIPVEISRNVFEIGNRNVMQGIFRDITERKQAEEQIQILSQAVEQSPVSIIITDTSGNIEYVNPKFSSLTGYSLTEVLGKNPRILKSGEAPIETYKQLWETITSGSEWRGEFHNKRKNGTLYWESVSISSIRNQRGKITHFLAVKEDITMKKIMTEELITAKEKAEESDQLKSEFLAQMSHEIRTPLNIILSYNYLLKDELEEEKINDYLTIFNSIDSASKRLLRTIDLILNMSAVQSGILSATFSMVDLNAIINRLLSEFQSTAESKNISLKYKPELSSIRITTDEHLVTEIFQNLIDNALKYTNRGNVELRVYKNRQNQVCIDVKDTGVGIAEEYLPELFKPFTQEESGYSRKYEGNGLGLALVKRYTEMIGAEINVRSKKDEGSIFTLIFNN